MIEDYDIGEAFRKIEEELIESMIRNLKHHRAEEIKEGYEWTQWQVVQLQALEEYRRNNKKIFNPQFQDINNQIPTLIELARQQGGMEQEISILKAIQQGLKTRKASDRAVGSFMRVNDDKLNALVRATQQDFAKAEHAVLRMSNDKYRKIIFNAQVYANAGGTTYEKAVDMATRDFLRAGINCIEYKNGARHTISDYADMCIKTATKRAYLTGEGEKRKEWGIATVIVNKRQAACPKCMKFAGVVLIDDVWSGGKPDGKHQLMSSAIEKGLYHPRCKDVHTTYFPGISTMPDKLSNEEKESLIDDYNEEQKQSYFERQAEQQERLAKYSLDSDNKKIYQARAEQWKNVRLRTGDGDTKKYTDTQRAESFLGKPADITSDWTKKENRTGSVKDLHEYVVDGQKYAVNGIHVKLDYSKHELEVAENIAKLYGKDVQMVPRIVYPQYKKTPDYIIDGERWDLKTISTIGKNVFYNSVKKKKRQADNFLFDITDCQMDMKDIEMQVLNLFRTTHLTNINNVALYKNGKLIKVYRRNK